MQIAILIFEKLTALDAVGPYEVLQSMAGWDCAFVAKEKGPIRTDSGALGLHADHSLDELRAADIVLVPGGAGSRPLMRDEAVLAWLREIDAQTKWTTSVCTGSLLLGAAGVLEGLEATSHWLDIETLERFGATPTSRRVVEQGKVITAAGVSSGIDMALALVAKLAGPEVAQAIQLGIEYDPQTPFDSGSDDKAAPEIVELVRSVAAARA